MKSPEKDLVATAAVTETRQILKGKYYSATGRRKRAIARVRLYSGSGKFILNHKVAESLDAVYLAPLVLVNKTKNFDYLISVSGGGISSQKEAIRHAISRALVVFDKNLKPSLRKAGFLTRDPREKERKKPGLKRARKAPQWQKR